MREQLIHYVDLLFAGAQDAGDIKQEILQNTLDRFDDLVAQGKTPEAAYSLAISGIGDISEILGGQQVVSTPLPKAQPEGSETPLWKKLVRGFAIFLYIISLIPLFVLSELGMETIGFCGTLAIVAVATTLMVIAGGKSSHSSNSGQPAPSGPQAEMEKAVKSIITTVGLVCYFVLSFLTQAWFITWLIFPIMAAVKGLVKACMDLKGASKYEV